MQSGREADDLLTEAVAHEEHRVLCNVGHQCRRGALVQAAQAHLFIRRHNAVDETPVHFGKGLHLDFCRIQRLPTEDTCRPALSRESKKPNRGGVTKMYKLIRIKSFNNLYKQEEKNRCLFSHTRAVTRDKNRGGLYCAVSVEAQREMSWKNTRIIKICRKGRHSV